MLLLGLGHGGLPPPGPLQNDRRNQTMNTYCKWSKMHHTLYNISLSFIISIGLKSSLKYSAHSKSNSIRGYEFMEYKIVFVCGLTCSFLACQGPLRCVEVSCRRQNSTKITKYLQSFRTFTNICNPTFTIIQPERNPHVLQLFKYVLLLCYRNKRNSVINLALNYSHTGMQHVV